MCIIYIYISSCFSSVIFVIKVCLFIFRTFDARRECNIRKYSYLLPAEIIGVKEDFTASEVDHHISDFNDILNTFEVCLLLRVLFLLMG